MNTPALIFETSWEICNNLGDVHTVIAEKANYINEKYNSNYILIGPDINRNEIDNSKFEEIPLLYSDWKKHAEKSGLRFRIGRWLIKGKPTAILLDFSNFVGKKNEIFTKFWEQFQLDSMAGGWDYIETAMFGYAVGKLIENFCEYNLNSATKVLAHFHGWQSGAGLLYLRSKDKNIATVFSLHSPILSRMISNNRGQLYNLPEDIKPFELSRNYNVISKHSMEWNAAHNADVFTVPSEFTAKQVAQFIDKQPDVITPYGLDNKVDKEGIRTEVREKIINVAEALLNKKLDQNTRLIFTSGEYNFYNKGINMIIDAVANLNETTPPETDTVVFLMFPTDNYGAREDLKNAIKNKTAVESNDHILTHFLHQSDYNEIMQAINNRQIQNRKEDKVNLIYCPGLLCGRDGIFNIPFKELTCGFDYGLFPYYYEAWGYTAHETLAKGTPIAISSLSGLGDLLKQQPKISPLTILDRTEDNHAEVTKIIEQIIFNCTSKVDENYDNTRQQVLEVANETSWQKLLPSHIAAYKKALEKIKGDLYIPTVPQKFKEVRTYNSNLPIWRDISVQSTLSQKLKGLEEIAQNLWWSWSPKAQELFMYIGKEKANIEALNPQEILKNIGYEKVRQFENDKNFMDKYYEVYKEYEKYINTKPAPTLPSVAYFSMEYGITDIMQIYSGGLGILAGDYLKEASDSRYEMHAVGLFYRQGYFTQKIGVNGQQDAFYESQIFSNLPAELLTDENGDAIYIQLALPGRRVNVQIWKVKVGRINLYLLDTDREDNNKEDRAITYRLYGGDNENRLKQELVLGIGGIRALRKMNIEAEIYHINEGHAAFIGFERMRQHMEKYKITFREAQEVVRSSSLFTTHTPVPAGHDSFTEDLLMTYLGHYPERLKISKEDFVNLGRQEHGKKSEKFSMSALAANFAQEINGVSKLHGEVTKYDIFNKMWDGYFPEELHIGYVTNGVHPKTWTATEWQELLINENDEIDFSKINSLSNSQIREIRRRKKNQLFEFIKKRLDNAELLKYENPKFIFDIKDALNPNALTIGFARRFATYKRGNLILRDLERLKKIVNNADRPVHIIFAGKAHPQDKAGQEIIQRIIEISKGQDFLGKILFLKNYKMSLAKYLVQGVDIWLNNPQRPKEASGTSGMKAVMNGVMNFSVLDGWWVEGYKEGAGWALPLEKTFDQSHLQDDLDAEVIYQTLENEIIPLYYEDGDDGLSDKWIEYIKKCMSDIAPNFTTTRMINDYRDRFYKKLASRNKLLRENNFEVAKRLADEKLKIQSKWNDIETVNIKLSDPVKNAMMPGEKYYGELVLDLKSLEHELVAAEIIISETDSDGNRHVVASQKLEYVKSEGSKAYYNIEMLPPGPGNYSYAFRIYPNLKSLPHRQDFGLVKWV